MKKISYNIQKIIYCPNCCGELKEHEKHFLCSKCELIYKYTSNGQLDLRLQKTKKISCPIELGDSIKVPKIRLLRMKPNPEVSFAGIETPHHLSSEILSYFPKAFKKNSLVLDLGCGDAIHREVCEHAGFYYVGVDYSQPKAPILADGHSLPFKDESFEFVLSIAVLEHIQHPLVFCREVCRVLKPGGVFIGSIAFMEPFHETSYYHHTHLGVANSLLSGGLSISLITVIKNWNGLKAILRMGMFPGIPRLITELISWPILMASRFWWRVARHFKAKATCENEITKTAGSYFFVARK
jgi:SAM-dependent methyltransferase